MCGKEDLCLMRTKNLSSNSLKDVKPGVALAVKYFNQFGLAILVVVAGFLVFLCRRNYREKIRRMYNPHDPRMGD